MSESRKFKRIEGEIEVNYRPVAGVPLGNFVGDWCGEAANVASGGVFVKTGTPLDVGTEVELQFSVPVRYDALLARGEVVWVDENSDHPGMGVKFSNIDTIAQYDLVRSTKPGAWIHAFGILQ